MLVWKEAASGCEPVPDPVFRSLAVHQFRVCSSHQCRRYLGISLSATADSCLLACLHGLGLNTVHQDDDSLMLVRLSAVWTSFPWSTCGTRLGELEMLHVKWFNQVNETNKQQPVAEEAVCCLRRSSGVVHGLSSYTQLCCSSEKMQVAFLANMAFRMGPHKLLTDCEALLHLRNHQQCTHSFLFCAPCVKWASRS